MASIRRENDRGRVGWRLQFVYEKRRRSIWVGEMSKTAATKVAAYVGELVRARTANVPPEPSAAKWLQSLDSRIYDALARSGVIEPKQHRILTDSDRLLEPFLTSYIESRTDLKESTREQYRCLAKLLIERFGKLRHIQTITTADAERWQRWLSATKNHAEATISKYTKRAKTCFAHAVKDRLLEENPFISLRCGSQANRSRDAFINRQMTYTVLKACPTAQWRAIFALARFGGLRRCEILTFGWSDILWDVGKLRIDSPKTGLRFCPLFPELRPYLQEAFEAAPVGSKRVAHAFSSGANIGTQLVRIILSAGIEPWNKPYQNLRASRRTELEEHYQNHVINSWLGHSARTAEKHYLQVTDDHWQAGIRKLTGSDCVLPSNGGVIGGVINRDSDSLTTTPKTKKPSELLGDDDCLLATAGGISYPARTRT